jgi:hypothetical protein
LAISVAVVVVLACIALGVYFRFAQYHRVSPSPDSDQSEGGLMAAELLKGQFPLLLWGQSYGGTIWMFPLALSLRIFGMTPFGLRFPAFVAGIVNAFLVYWVAVEAGWSRARAAVAGGVYWVFPLAAALMQSLDAGYFNPALTAELIALALAFRIDRRRDTPSTRRRVLFGLTIGIGLWTNPGVVYLALPATIWLLARDLVTTRRVSWPLVRDWLWSTLGVVVGAFPWWFLALFRTDAAGLHAMVGTFSVGAGLKNLFGQQLPGVLGFKTPWGPEFSAPWQHGTWSKALYIVLAVVLIAQIVRSFWNRSSSLMGACAVFLPLAYLTIAAQTGLLYSNLRYVFLGTPVLVFLMGLGWKRDLVAIGAMAILPVLSIWSFAAWIPAAAPSASHVEPLAAFFRENHIPCGISDYWAGGNRLMFALDDKVPVASLYAARNPLYVEEAETGGNCAWVFNRGAKNEIGFRKWLEKSGIQATRTRLPNGVVVYQPERRVWIDEVPLSARAP